MREKILLVDPIFQRIMGFAKEGINLGLLYIAGELKKNGHDVSVRDFDYYPDGHHYTFIEKIDHFRNYLNILNNVNHPVWEDVVSDIREASPDVVGISMISVKYRSGLMLAKIAKELGVKRVIVGGPHATLLPNEVLKSEYVDSVVVGEGEV